MAPIPYQWAHMALVFYGPHQGIVVYMDGNLVGSDLIGLPEISDLCDGNVVLGRGYASRDSYYGDVTVDELYFWDQPLGAAVVQQLYNTY